MQKKTLVTLVQIAALLLVGACQLDDAVQGYRLKLLERSEGLVTEELSIELLHGALPAQITELEVLLNSDSARVPSANRRGLQRELLRSYVLYAEILGALDQPGRTAAIKRVDLLARRFLAEVVPGACREWLGPEAAPTSEECAERWSAVLQNDPKELGEMAVTAASAWFMAAEVQQVSGDFAALATAERARWLAEEVAQMAPRAGGGQALLALMAYHNHMFVTLNNEKDRKTALGYDDLWLRQAHPDGQWLRAWLLGASLTGVSAADPSSFSPQKRSLKAFDEVRKDLGEPRHIRDRIAQRYWQRMRG